MVAHWLRRLCLLSPLPTTIARTKGEQTKKRRVDDDDVDDVDGGGGGGGDDDGDGGEGGDGKEGGKKKKIGEHANTTNVVFNQTSWWREQTPPFAHPFMPASLAWE